MRFFLALGSDLGAKKKNILTVLRLLKKNGSIKISYSMETRLLLKEI